MVSCYVTRDGRKPFDVEAEALKYFEIKQKYSFGEKSGIYLPVNINDGETHLRSIRLPFEWFCNGFVGMDYLASKKFMAQILQNAYQSDILQFYLPETYTNFHVLPPSKDSDKWVLKKDTQGQTGVKLVHGDPRKHIESDTVVIQRFVEKPLLFKNHKVNFRIYIGCIVNDHANMYFYSKDGLVYYSQKPYTKGDWITTGYTENRDVYNERPTLVSDLLGTLSSTLRHAIQTNIRKALTLLMDPYRSILKPITRCSYQLFGVDLHIGANGQVVIMEVNKSPDFNVKSEMDGALKHVIMRKFYEAVFTSCIDPAVFQKLF